MLQHGLQSLTAAPFPLVDFVCKAQYHSFNAFHREAEILHAVTKLHTTSISDQYDSCQNQDVMRRSIGHQSCVMLAWRISAVWAG